MFTVEINGRQELIDKIIKKARDTASLKGRVVIYCDHPAGPFIEYGTAPHDIYPKNALALHWQTTSGWHMTGMGFGAKPKAETADVFSKHVHHPGTAPMPFMRPALEYNKDAIKDILNSVHTGSMTAETALNQIGILVAETAKQLVAEHGKIAQTIGYEVSS